MRNPFRRRSVERVLEEAFRWIMIDLRSPDSELRNAIVRVARSETKNMFGQHLDTEVEKFDRILADRVARALADMGSAAGTFSEHVIDVPGLTCVKCKLSIQEHTSPAGKIVCPDSHASQAIASGKPCICPPYAYQDFNATPDCPMHGDPKVLAQLEQEVKNS